MDYSYLIVDICNDKPNCAFVPADEMENSIAVKYFRHGEKTSEIFDQICEFFNKYQVDENCAGEVSIKYIFYVDTANF